MKSCGSWVGVALLTLGFMGCETGSEVNPDLGRADVSCQPECREIGSRSEGWYDSCTGDLIGWVACDGCVASCDAIGSRSEGWYDSCGVGMNGAGLIQWAECADSPEPEVCTPVCDEIGSRSEGWYDSCTGDLIGWVACSECEEPRCDAIGSRSEGWYTSEGCGANGDDLIGWADCAPEETPEPLCAPVCDAIGSRSEGWYDSCTGDLIGWMTCSECEEPRCDAIGSRSEGWYTSEGCGAFGDDLIGWADCAPDETLPEPLCAPICDAIGSRSEGWYDSCTGDLIGWMTCSECEEPRCDAVGSRSEGWYTSEGCGAYGGDLILWADC